MSYETTPRTGRHNQVFSKDGSRLVAGCLVFNKELTQILLISATSNKHKWVLPKGGVENDERDDFSKTALRETWEEAGLQGEILNKNAIIINDTRSVFGDMKEVNGVLINPPKSRYYFYKLENYQLFDEYPESHKRKRRWFDVDDAVKELNSHKRWELANAITEYLSK